MNKFESFQLDIIDDFAHFQAKLKEYQDKAIKDPIHFVEWSVPEFSLLARKVNFLTQYLETLTKIASGELVVTEEMLVQTIGQSIRQCCHYPQDLSTSSIREVNTQVNLMFHKWTAHLNWRLSKALEIESPTLTAFKSILN